MLPYEIIEFDKQRSTGNVESMQVNSSLDEINSLLNDIDDNVNNALPNFEFLRATSFELIQRLPLPVQMLQNTFILRSRENFNGELFHSSSHLSYNPFPEKISPGRFNLKREPAFYGALPITSSNASGQLTSLIESCKELFDTSSKFKEKYFTVGKWNIVKPIRTVMLTFYTEAEQKSIHLQNLNPHYLKFITSTCSQEDVEKCLRFYSFFSEFAGKKYDSEAKYLVTTAFFHALKLYYGNELAILYSSSMTENTGLNIVMTKEVIDNRYLEFKGAAMFKTVRNRTDSKLYHLYPSTNYAVAGKDGKFSFNYVL